MRLKDKIVYTISTALVVWAIFLVASGCAELTPKWCYRLPGGKVAEGETLARYHRSLMEADGSDAPYPRACAQIYERKPFSQCWSDLWTGE